MQPYSADPAQPYPAPSTSYGMSAPAHYLPAPMTRQHPPARPAPKSPASQRMSKQEALALTRWLKRVTIGAALAAFMALAGLAGAHVTGITSASQSSPSSTAPGSTDGSSQPATQQNNPFFGNQPGGGSFGSGSGSQNPVTGTSTS